MTTETPAFPDVKYNTIDFITVGAFMIAMSRQPAANYPTTVEAFCKLLANYARKYTAYLTEGEGRLDRSPEIVTEETDSPLFAAYFKPLDTDTSDNPLGHWVVDGVLEVQHVHKTAAMTLFQNNADHVNIRLPEKNNIAKKENDALKHQTDDTMFQNLTYLDDYFAGKTTAMQFVWGNVGDYTTRSCR